MNRSVIQGIAAVVGVVVLIVLLASWKESSPAPLAPEEGWREHRFKDGGYRVSLPGAPEPKEMSMDLPLAELPALRVVGRGVELKRDELPGYFFVCHFPLDFPRKFLDENYQKLNYAIAEAVVKSYGGRVFKFGTLPVEGRRPLTELDFEFRDGARSHRYHAHFHYDKGRFYQVAGITLAEKAPAEFVQRFLDSFKFLP